jgi:TRAP transporter TAXI family solute receptor
MSRLKRMSRIAKYPVFVFVAIVVLSFTPDPAAGIEPVNLVITAGTAGGGYYRACAAVAEYIKKDIPGSTVTVMPGGTWANLERLSSKKADIGIIENVSSTLAWRGTPPSPRKYDDFRTLAAIRGPSIDQVLVLEETGIKTFEDIKQKKFPLRLVTLEATLLNVQMAEAIFNAYGITNKDIESWGGKIIRTNFNEMVRLMLDGLADAYAGGAILYPQPKFFEIGRVKKFRMLPISKAVCQKMADMYGIETKQLPADIYKDHNGVNEPYWTTLTNMILVVRAGLSDDLVYNLAKTLANHKEELYQLHRSHRLYTPETAWKGIGAAPLHPGAERYYKSMGYMR